MDHGTTLPGRISTVVVGAGQSGLSAGYHLKRRGIPFIVLEASERVGDVWRDRWDSLSLFTPSRYDGLPGMRFPGPAFAFPTKNEMADYLEAYAARFELPVHPGVRVSRVAPRNGSFLVQAGYETIEADNVIIAMASYQRPRVPAFGRELDPAMVQLHSSEYRRPMQLADGPVLIVGAGNSGAEIAMEVAREHRTWLAGRDVGQLPFRISGTASRLILSRLLLRFVFHRVLTTSTPIGRRVRRKILHVGGPLIRQHESDLERVGIVRAPRVEGVRDGLPMLADGRTLPVANVIWCTGFHPGFSWIELPVFDEHGHPRHQRGIVAEQPGLYFVGLHFLHSLSSAMIHGADRDASYIVRAIAGR